MRSAREHLGMADAFDFTTLTPGTIEIGPLRVTTRHMNHPVETFGFRIEHAGPGPGVLGRHRPDRASLSGSPRGADVLLSEASFLDGPDLPPTCT